MVNVAPSGERDQASDPVKSNFCPLLSIDAFHVTLSVLPSSDHFAVDCLVLVPKNALLVSLPSKVSLSVVFVSPFWPAEVFSTDMPAASAVTVILLAEPRPPNWPRSL